MFSVLDLCHWLMLAAATDLPLMLAARFLAGFAGGGSSPNIQIYVAEISQPGLRAVMLGVTGPVMGLGLLTVYGLGDFLAWRWLAVISAAVPASLALGCRQDISVRTSGDIFGFSFLYDSPYWYLQNNQEDKSLKALKQIREKDCDVRAELEKLKVTIDERNR